MWSNLRIDRLPKDLISKLKTIDRLNSEINSYYTKEELDAYCVHSNVRHAYHSLYIEGGKLSVEQT